MRTLFFTNMRRLALLAISMVLSYSAFGQPLAIQKTTATEGVVCGLPVTDVIMKRSGDLMLISMNLNLSDFELKGDRAAILMPVLINGADSVELAPVGLYSHVRYIQYLREENMAIGGETETSYKYSHRPATMAYTQTLPYAAWMNGADMYIHRTDYGCCRSVLNDAEAPLVGWREITYAPAFHYIAVADSGEKVGKLSGRAFVDFPVNRTELFPDYRNNQRELAKIIASIDSVRNDKDITVTSITIKGYASPEGPYDNNIRLAKGRTATLKQYVQNLYRFSDGFIKTDYEPEDWEGLREYVVGSDLAEKDGILQIIDSNMAPDPKNTKIQTTYPEAYKFLLQTVYPGLRHSDYTIDYVVRYYTSIEEIAAIYATAPHKLSVGEMMRYAMTLETGSDKYNEIFETAARLYPANAEANINAANAAMQRNDMVLAAKYLEKAGTSNAAVYTRGVYAALTGDYKTAKELFKQTASTIEEAAAAAAEIEAIEASNQ